MRLNPSPPRSQLNVLRPGLEERHAWLLQGVLMDHGALRRLPEHDKRAAMQLISFLFEGGMLLECPGLPWPGLGLVTAAQALLCCGACAPEDCAALVPGLLHLLGRSDDAPYWPEARMEVLRALALLAQAQTAGRPTRRMGDALQEAFRRQRVIRQTIPGDMLSGGLPYSVLKSAMSGMLRLGAAPAPPSVCRVGAQLLVNCGGALALADILREADLCAAREAAATLLAAAKDSGLPLRLAVCAAGALRGCARLLEDGLGGGRHASDAAGKPSAAGQAARLLLALSGTDRDAALLSWICAEALPALFSVLARSGEDEDATYYVLLVLNGLFAAGDAMAARLLHGPGPAARAAAGGASGGVLPLVLPLLRSSEGTAAAAAALLSFLAMGPACTAAARKRAIVAHGALPALLAAAERPERAVSLASSSAIWMLANDNAELTEEQRRQAAAVVSRVGALTAQHNTATPLGH